MIGAAPASSSLMYNAGMSGAGAGAFSGGGSMPGWLGPAAVSVGQTLAGAFGGGQQQAPGKGHIVNPVQQALLYGLMARAPGVLQGSGDFGFGQATKQMRGTLGQMMADRGISPATGGGGLYAGLMSNMLSQAGAADAQARRNYVLGLAGTPVQTLVAQGWDPDLNRSADLGNLGGVGNPWTFQPGGGVGGGSGVPAGEKWRVRR